jgi:hypothetical protein
VEIAKIVRLVSKKKTIVAFSSCTTVSLHSYHNNFSGVPTMEHISFRNSEYVAGFITHNVGFTHKSNHNSLMN